MANYATNTNDDIGSIETLTEYQWLKNKPYLDTFKTGRYFVFMTKPQLFINPDKPINTNNTDDVIAYENMCADSKFTQYLISECHNRSDELIIKSLSYKYFSDIKSSFLPIITNLCKNADLMDISLETNASFTTRRGYNILMPGKTEGSRAANTISLRFTETHNLDITKLIKLWVEYIANITDGTFMANPTMIKNNVLDYMSSIYVFILDEDGKTIKHYCKYTGVYPVSSQDSNFNSSIGDSNDVELNVNFVYTLYESMDPRILEDFNRTTLKVITDENKTADYDMSGDNVDYMPISTSSLLNKNKLFGNPSYKELLNSELRDPIVYYEKRYSSAISGSMSSRYVLSFGKESIKNKQLKSIFDDLDDNIYDDYYSIYEDD